MESKYKELRSLDVSKHIEKKNGLAYLSWAWAVDELLLHDPSATWEYKEPVRFNDTLMVFCAVSAFGKTMTAQLPVMDHRNKAIPNPDAFEVNKAMQRCLAKAIALHGIGLYIYAGEDLPEAPPAGMQENTIADFVAAIEAAPTLQELGRLGNEAKAAAEAANDRSAYAQFKATYARRKKAIEAPQMAEQA
jgi:hypothetical protein